MSTRGFIAWTIDGETTYTYNHSDSYPSYLGVRVLDDLSAILRGYPDPRDPFRTLRLVPEDADAAPDDILQYGGPQGTAQHVSTGTDNYALFRDLQGDLSAMLATGVACTQPEPSGDSEWGYVLDFDADTLSVTGGGYGRPQTTALRTWPLSALPTPEEMLALEA